MAQATKSHPEKKSREGAEKHREMRKEKNGSRPKQVWNKEEKVWKRGSVRTNLGQDKKCMD